MVNDAQSGVAVQILDCSQRCRLLDVGDQTCVAGRRNLALVLDTTPAVAEDQGMNGCDLDVS